MYYQSVRLLKRLFPIQYNNSNTVDESLNEPSNFVILPPTLVIVLKEQ